MPPRWQALVAPRERRHDRAGFEGAPDILTARLRFIKTHYGSRGTGTTVLRWLRNSFIYGIAVATPIGITVWLVYLFVTFVDSTIMPLIPVRYNPETYLPFALPGMGVIIAIVLLTALGAVAANIFGRTLISIGERVVRALPLIRNIYNALKQLVDTAMSGTTQAFKEVVLVQYPMEGSWVVGFVASQARGLIGEVVGGGTEESLYVYVPTTPNPTSGFLIIVPRSMTVVLDISIEEAAKLIISFGLITPENLPEGAVPEDAGVAEPKKTGAAGKDEAKPPV